MKGFIVVNSTCEGEMLINVNSIVCAYKQKNEDKAVICFTTERDDFIHVHESYDEVVEKIRQATQ